MAPPSASNPEPGAAAAPARRLAAVMLADVAGYSRMMERDEAGTHLRLREVRASVTDPSIARHRGRLVRSKGDDLLVEFGSAVDALSCAVEIQRTMVERNRDLAPASRIEFRIGINLGDILIDGAEIAGDGVNVAARLETLAEPGEVAISQAVREQVRQLVGVRLIDAGHHRVKNISRPIRVFKVSTEAGRRRPRLQVVGRRLRRPLTIAAGIALAAAAALGAVRYYGAERAGAFSAPRESVVVLPTSPAAGEARPVADALTRQLTSALSQSLSGTVVAPSAAARIMERAADPRDAGRQLNVRYVVETGVVAAGERVRVEARLIATENGAQLWSSAVEADRRGAEEVPLEILGRLTDTLTTEIRRVELARAQAAGTEPDAYVLWLRATAQLPNATTPESIDEVRRMLVRAVALEPENAAVLAALASTLGFQAIDSFDPARRSALLDEADVYSQRAVAAGPNHAEAWLVRSVVLSFRGEFAAAGQALDRSLSLNPYEDETHAQQGRLLVSIGEPEKAVAALDHALRLNPDGPMVGVHLYDRCRALLYLGRYQQAIDSCTRATAFTPDWPDYMMLAAAYAQAGDAARAAQARDELLRRRPQFRVSWLRNEAAPVNEVATRQREAHLVAGLRRAGVPE